MLPLVFLEVLQGLIPFMRETYPLLVFVLLLVKVLVGASLGVPRGGTGFNPLCVQNVSSVGFFCYL